MAPTLNCNHEAPHVAHSLRGEGFEASEDGTGRGTPLVPVGVTIHGTDLTVQKVASYDELAQCLRARTPGNIDNSSTTVVQQPVAYGIRTANTSSNGWGIQEECTHPLDCAQGVAVAQPVVHAIQAGALRVNPASGPDGVGVQADHAYTLEARAEVQAVQSAMQVRRLTPTEAERLQGFPDNYTRVPNWNGWRKLDSSETPDQCISEGLEVKLNKKTGKWRVKDVDGPRYKALGNSMATPCMFFIGSRIDAAVSAGKAAKKGCA
jgi:DNA (cytosine-5)-methyltransferase 1